MGKLGINEMADVAYGQAVKSGFHKKKTTTERVLARLALIHSEVSEALEDARVLPPEQLKTLLYQGESRKPNGFMAELADVVIRVGDLAGEIGGDLEKAIKEKMAYNATRDFKHGKRA